jgi:hypothetical protein
MDDEALGHTKPGASRNRLGIIFQLPAIAFTKQLPDLVRLA